jgi:hypothetical protein
MDWSASVPLGCTCHTHTDAAFCSHVSAIRHTYRVAFQRVLSFQKGQEISSFSTASESRFSIEALPLDSFVFLFDVNVSWALFQLPPPSGEHGLCWFSCTKPLGSAKTVQLFQAMAKAWGLSLPHLFVHVHMQEYPRPVKCD